MSGKCMIFAFVFSVEIFIIINAQRGQPCYTPNEKLATCKSIYDCGRFIKAINEHIPSQLIFIKKSQCGYDTTPLVCCGLDIDFLSTRHLKRTVRSTNSTTFIRNPAIPDRKICGFQEYLPTNKKVIGGTHTHYKEYPWMVLLGYTTRSGKIRWSCGGTLISHKYVLTAAHCVKGDVEALVGQITYVKLGEYNITKHLDCNKNANCSTETVIAGIKNVSVHENYDPTDRTSRNDIALIHLNQTIEYTDIIKPICLPEPNEGSSTTDRLIVAGWGLTENGSYSNVKLQVFVPFLTNDECITAFRILRLNLTDSQICAGGEDGKDACKGDSGGPLMRRSKSNPLQWYQEGIVSFGNTECGTAGLPGVYTKVLSFLSWIHSHVKE
ncbi:phenoloxidase-activating factor 1-like [Diabrotica undecimpunctata]|uniref:phenoloxidase-activating factor 1-like n=1 Tax=Diabrotica undecimpunctata TaxID=50387 RepID=UPI003B63E969